VSDASDGVVAFTAYKAVCARIACDGVVTCSTINGGYASTSNCDCIVAFITVNDERGITCNIYCVAAFSAGDG